MNSIAATTTYTLTCTGSGGATTRSMIVNVTAAPGVSGAVDSSLVSRHQESANLVYAFAGSNTTTGTPVATSAVIQDSGACTFRYALAGLAAGNYTVALTSDSGASFKRSANVTVPAAGVVQNFTPSRVIQVGPTRTVKHPNNVTGLASGDVVEIDAGVYTDAVKTWTTSNLTLRGVGGRAHLVAPATISNGKAIWVTQGANMMVENIEFSDAAVVDLNGAGIRAEGQDLAICGSYFHDNQEGILGGAGRVLIEYTEFARNGNCDDPNGCAHNIYIDNIARFTLRYSYSHHARIGHTVKSRAQENYILYNRIMDEADGTSSYTIDLPNGGLTYIIGNLLQQSPFTDNPTIVAYGAEGLTNTNRTLYVVNNTFVNDLGSGTFISIAGGTTATVRNNLFVGNGSTPVTGGTVTQISNQRTSTPNFANVGAFDYRSTAGTPGINGGTAPGLGGTFDLTPLYQYVHPTNREPRALNGVIDIGAYEFVP
jgi:parallel beta helix pectate lyase-like protein